VRGVPLFRADAEHIHHRLILLGYSKGRRDVPVIVDGDKVTIGFGGS